MQRQPSAEPVSATKLKAVRTSEEGMQARIDVVRNFEELIQSDETIQYTLTPESMRDLDVSTALFFVFVCFVSLLGDFCYRFQFCTGISLTQMLHCSCHRSRAVPSPRSAPSSRSRPGRVKKHAGALPVVRLRSPGIARGRLLRRPGHRALGHTLCRMRTKLPATCPQGLPRTALLSQGRFLPSRRNRVARTGPRLETRGSPANPSPSSPSSSVRLVLPARASSHPSPSHRAYHLQVWP